MDETCRHAVGEKSTELAQVLVNLNKEVLATNKDKKWGTNT